jgi:cytochrome c oxidase subunit 2
MRRRAVIQMIVIGLLAGIVTGGVAYFIPWLPDQASTQAEDIDEVYWFVAIICAIIFALVAGVAIYAGWKFRAPSDDMDDGSPIHGHTGLEIWWTAIPVVLVVAMSVWSAVALARAERLPDNPDEYTQVEVTAAQFAWSFTYPELDRTEGELVLRVNQPVELLLTSNDVIHAFWVPEFRMKQDAVPGIQTQTVITPTKEGSYDVICTELCGLGHAVMRAGVRVLSDEDYEAWVAEGREGGEGDGGGEGEGDGEAAGDAVFAEAGCGSCHALADAGTTAELGPDLDSVLEGRDEEFILTSIVDPNAEIAEGYQPNVMPDDYEDSLSEAELDALVAYLVETAGAGR